jgi:hypothetical protein
MDNKRGCFLDHLNGVKRNAKRGETSAILDETSASFLPHRRFMVLQCGFIGKRT